MKRDRVFWAALIFSFVFHLSMVTLFSIVLYFPRQDIEYLQFSIVHTPAEAASVSAAPPTAASDSLPATPQQQLQSTSPEEAFARARGADAPLADRLGASLPPISLPAIPFAEQELLRSRTQSLELRARYEELFEPEPQDTWSRFGRRLGQLGDELQRLALGDSEEEEALIPVSRPAPGFEAYLEWLEPPHDRQVLAVEKIEALWGYDPQRLPRPIVLVFRVNREGRVVFVLPPVEDRDGIVPSAVQALLQYRFEPLGEEAPDRQEGTLIVQAASETAP